METPELISIVNLLIEQLSKLRDHLDSGPIDVPAESWKKADSRICLNCGKTVKPEQKYVQGVDQSCKRAIDARIKRGEISLRKAIESGILLPKGKSGRKPREDTKLAEVISDYELDELNQLEAISKAMKSGTAKKKAKTPKRKTGEA